MRRALGAGRGVGAAHRRPELHGGTVQALGAGLGLGSELVVRLPLSRGDAPPVPSATPLPVLQPVQPVHTARRILIADDNRDAAHTLALLLSTYGHHVRIANDGLQAVQEAQAFAPEIVLLDIGMPGLNGYDAARAIRARQGDDKAVLIATTGWGQDEDRRRSTEAGFDHHLVKPVDTGELMRLIAALPH